MHAVHVLNLRHVVPRHQHSFPRLKEGMLRLYSIRTVYALRALDRRIASRADLDLSTVYYHTRSLLDLADCDRPDLLISNTLHINGYLTKKGDFSYLD